MAVEDDKKNNSAVTEDSFFVEAPKLSSQFDDVNVIFNVSKEKKNEIKEKYYNDIQDGKIEVPLGLDTLNYANQLAMSDISKLQNELNDAKVQYISEISGLNVINESLPAGENMSLHFLLGRDLDFKNRRKRFLKFFPEGEFTKLTIPMGGDTTEDFEVFKLPGDKNYRMFDSIGNDYFSNELLQFAGSMTNFQTLGDVLGSLSAYSQKTQIPVLKGIGFGTDLLLKTFRGIANNPLFRVGFGNLFGKNVDQAVDAYYGYDKGAFAQEGDLPFLYNFANFNNLQEAALSAGVFKAFDFIPAYLSGNTKLVTKNQITKEIADISNKYNLEPAMVGQLIASPFFRRTFFQSAEFNKLPKEKFASQIKSATDLLNQMADGEKFTMDLVLGAQKTLEENYQNAILSVVRGNMSPDQAADVLNEAFVKWNTASNNSVSEIRQTIAGLASKNGELNGESLLIQNVQNSMKQSKRNIQAFNKGEKITIIDDTGAEKVIEPKVYFGGKDKDSQILLGIINDFNKLPAVLNFTSTPVTSRHINSLIQVQRELFNLRFSDNPFVASEARALHKKIKNIFKDAAEGADVDSDMAFNMQALYSQMDANENVRGINFVVDAITNNKANVRTVVNDFITPGNFQIHALKTVLDETGSSEAFGIVKDLWLRKTLQDPTKTASILAKWQADDPNGLALLMEGVDYKEIDDIVELGLKANSNIFKETIEKGGTTNELIKSVLRTVKADDFVGKQKAIDDIIADSGAFADGKIDYNHPFMVSARQGILQEIFEKAIKFQRDLDGIKVADGNSLSNFFKLNAKQNKDGDLLTLQPEFDITKINKLISNLKNDEALSKFFTPNQLEKISAIDRYFTIINSANPKVGSVLQQAELGADLVQNMFNAPGLFNIGTTLIKYDILARALSQDVTLDVLSSITEDQLRSNPSMIIKGLLTSLTRDITGDFGINDENYLQSFDSYMEMSPDKPPEALSNQLPSFEDLYENQNTKPLDVTLNAPINASTLSNLSLANNRINTNTAAAGQRVFGTDDPVFSGIANTNVGRQVVA